MTYQKLLMAGVYAFATLAYAQANPQKAKAKKPAENTPVAVPNTEVSPEVAPPPPALSSPAATAAPAEATAQLGLLPRIQIVGDNEGLEKISGSAQVLNLETLRQYESDDVHQTMRKVPGLVVKEEEGYGLRPNIGIRGSNPNRSAKILLMEDGIPIAPAPYSAPEAYFFPLMGRMHQIEVIKGAGSIKYGPNNISGVINMVSTPIPQKGEGFVKAGFGSNYDIKNHLTWGDTVDLGAGKLGYVAESYYLGSRGWQQLDVGGSDNLNTGFEKWEPMFKLAFQPVTKIKQVFEAKVGYTEEDSRQSYLGLTDEDAKNHPDRRYAASQRDRMYLNQKRGYVKYYLKPSELLEFTATAYYNAFHRNWFKLGSQAKNFTNPAQLAGIKGEANALNYEYRHNNRDYYAYGAELVSRLHLKSGSIKNDTELGLRYHTDGLRRFQRNEYFDMANGTLIPSVTLTAAQINATLPGGQDNKKETVQAISAYLTHGLTLASTTITPGVRLESLRLNYLEYEKVTTTQAETEKVKFDNTRELLLLLPGLGISQKFSEELVVFGGVHWGATPPSPAGATLNQRDATRKSVEFEKSLNYELGSRYTDDKKGVRLEGTGFYNRYFNMTAQENLGSGNTTDANIGKVSVYGAEAMAGYDPGRHNKWTFSLPLFVSVTFTKGVFDSVDETLNPTNAVGSALENIFLNAKNGNKLPYLPEIQLTLGAGIIVGRFGLNVEGVYFTAAYSDGGNTEATKLPGAILMNASAKYFISDTAEIFVAGRNLTNERYVVSYVPDGARVSRGLNVMAGMSTRF